MTLKEEEVFHGLFLADPSVSGSSSAKSEQALMPTEKHSESLLFKEGGSLAWISLLLILFRLV